MVLDRGVIMKPLTLEETRLKEEMKSRCLAKGQYVDENAKKKFDMLCHLEDFEIKYWELQEESKRLNGAIQTYDILLKSNIEENKQLKDNWNELKKWLRIKDILANSKINPQSIKFKDLLKHMEYLEKER